MQNRQEPFFGTASTSPVPASDQPDEVLTEREAAQRTRLSERTLQRYAEDGRGPARIKLGARRVGYWKSDIDRWLRERTAPAKQHAA